MSKSIESRVESLEKQIKLMGLMTENLAKRLENEEKEGVATDIQYLALQAAITFLLADAKQRNIDVTKFKNNFINSLKDTELELPDDYRTNLIEKIESLFS